MDEFTLNAIKSLLIKKGIITEEEIREERDRVIKQEQIDREEWYKQHYGY